MSTSFDQHRATLIRKSRRKLIDLGLKQRFSTRQLDKVAIVFGDFCHYLAKSHRSTASECKLRIAPRTPEIAAGCSHKYAGQSRVARFTLDALIDFRDSHSSNHSISGFKAYASLSLILDPA